MTSRRGGARAYQEPRVLAVLFLGFSSGLPFLLTLATLHVWLLEVGVSKTGVGVFAFVTLPYALKFIWAPFLDRIKFPFLCTVFGRRKGWMLASQIGLIFSLLFLGSTHPQTTPWMTAVAAFLVAMCSATQDIVVEAYRIEALQVYDRGPGAGASSFGYRLGMWVSGAGALYLASSFSWFSVYAFMAGCVFVGIVTTLLTQEPEAQDAPSAKISASPPVKIRDYWAQPLQKLLARPEIGLSVAFIFLYKIGDTVLNTMTMPFLLEVGFSKIEIAHVAKSFGITAAVAGSLIGGLLLAKRPLVSNLILCAFLQVLASLMFMMQAWVGHNLPCLFLSMGLENMACGMGTTAYLVYLSSRCMRPFTATHFALLCSFGSLCRVLFSCFAGWLADHTSWETFYLLSAFACLPCVMLLYAFPNAFEGFVGRESNKEPVGVRA